MAEEIKLYRVFIATPSGLENERSAFRETLNEYNESEAVHRKAFFLPVGWEDTLAGVGRPQSLINADLLHCDYFVLILYDRWGTPPGGTSQYTSGTEEEFRVAMECVSNQQHSMREVVVFFKPVDEYRLKDPGEQLKKVIAFKKELEANRSLLFSPAIHPIQFAQTLRRHLARWLREHELGSLRDAYTKVFASPPVAAPDWSIQYTREFMDAVSYKINGAVLDLTEAALNVRMQDSDSLLRLLNKLQLLNKGELDILSLKPAAGANDPFRMLQEGRLRAYVHVDDGLRRGIVMLLTVDGEIPQKTLAQYGMQE